MGIFTDNEAGVGSSIGEIVLQSGQFKMPAAEVIAAGELLTQLETGKVLPFRKNLGLSIENNNTAGPVAAISPTVVSAMTGQFGFTAKKLSNDCIAILYINAGGANYTLRVITPSGGSIFTNSSFQATGGGIGVDSVSIIPLKDKFVAVWQEYVSSTQFNTFFAIHSNDGTQLVAKTAINSGVANSQNGVRGLGLSTGDFIVAYHSNNQTRFKRFNSSGVLQGSETALDSTITRCQVMEMRELANGDFLVYYYNDSNWAVYWSRWSSVGVLVGSRVTISTANNYIVAHNYSFDRQLTAELTNGNIVCLWANSAGTDRPTAYIKTSAGAAVATVDWSAYVTPTDRTVPAIVALSNGGFAAFLSAGINVRLFLHDNSGAITHASSDLSGQMGSLNGGGAGAQLHSVIELTPASFAISRFSSNGTSHEHKMALYTTTSGIGTAVSLDSGTFASVLGLACPVVIGKRVVYYPFATPTYSYKHACYNMMKSSIIGVAQESVNSGVNVKIASSGYFAIPEAQALPTGTTFDCLAFGVPGAKGKFVSNNIILNPPAA